MLCAMPGLTAINSSYTITFICWNQYLINTHKVTAFMLAGVIPVLQREPNHLKMKLWCFKYPLILNSQNGVSVSWLPTMQPFLTIFLIVWFHCVHQALL